MRLSSEVQSFLEWCAPVAAGDGIVVAFSGGPDSTALLWALMQLAPAHDLRISAFHVDHGFDHGSSGRRAAAAALAHRLGAPFRGIRLEGPVLRQAGEGVEEAGRRLRYAALEEERLRLGARYVATAHHRDDQAETVVLRLLLGSGLEGLAGILPVRGTVIRPLLGLSRKEIAVALSRETRGLEMRGGTLVPVLDPTNLDLDHLRNRVRSRLLPRLEVEEPGISGRLAALADRCGRARRHLEPVLQGALAPTRDAAGRLTVEMSALRALPLPLFPYALSYLHRQAGAPHPPGVATRGELQRQLRGAQEGQRLGCDCGQGWRWEIRGDAFSVCPPARPRPEGKTRFTYTLRIPGEIEIREISARLKVSPGAERSSARAEGFRVGLSLQATADDLLTLRTRLPGDRLRPLGAPGRRRLKEILIDRGIPREIRDRLPLVCCGDRIAWIPGVTIEHDFRMIDGVEAWTAELIYS